MHNFNNLQIWQMGMDLAQAIYQVCENLPHQEQYGLISQMQRAAVSIPSNISEGAGRATDKDFSHFIDIALGSSFELQTQVLLAERIGYIDGITKESLLSTIDKLQKMMIGYKKKLESHNEVVPQRSGLTSHNEVIQTKN